MVNFIHYNSYLKIPETVSKTGMVMVFGEVTTTAKVDYEKVIRQTIKKIGYDHSSKGTNGDTYQSLALLVIPE